MPYNYIGHSFINAIKLFTCFSIVGCITNNNEDSNIFREIILYESCYRNGNPEKIVTKGRTPGEDTYLKILIYDTVGKVSSEYGSQHYGRKYKSIFMYAPNGKLIEEHIYSFDTLNGNFENYSQTYHDYSIQDTFANYKGIISTKIFYQYIKNYKILNTFELNLDSDNTKNQFILSSIDTFELE